VRAFSFFSESFQFLHGELLISTDRMHYNNRMQSLKKTEKGPADAGPFSEKYEEYTNISGCLI